MKIFDVFMFCNELDLLEIRLNILYPFVDYFVINESTKTFSCFDKPLYYAENSERFSKFKDKIIYNVISPPSQEELNSSGLKYNTQVPSFQMDAYQKDSIKDFLNGICSDDDIIIWSDLDEIPNPDAIENLNEYYDGDAIYNFAQEYCMGYFNMIEKTGVFRSQTPDFDYEDYPRWIGTKLFKFEYLKKYTFTQIRQSNDSEKNIRIFPGGWHWTYVGSLNSSTPKERFVQKLHSGPHQEHNNESVRSLVEDRLKLNLDPLGRNGCRYEVVEIDDTYPKYILDNLEKYSYLVKHVSN